ncbi:integrase arm-type DNA-binding domain-containing protein [Bradyrhizobium japonicum]|uniref:integrase arm-type DNA-binding domain-containing protein n=1 Tax=Bradyrhizobium japonicum TaxID=375 RepID=UPI0027149841|nr:integrase arm-type DNA-binding domain-containing protein [Bradyrhizobium japonicum]WLB54840.1 integrase arm-type DNA-binding domain-containing protein [Bradyrhizobium japonicum]WLB63285.1 integrase arm-type DNA-binding domain-containing protein [Bradyrhizobium japonicum]
MPGVPYERTSKALTPVDVWRAVRISRTPEAKAREIEWRDTECAGLTLRITKTDASWLIRRRDRTIKIGRCAEIPLPTARYIAHRTREAAKRGRDLKVFVDTLVKMRSHGFHGRTSYDDNLEWLAADELADDNSELGKRRLRGETHSAWTWRQLTERFLEEKLPELKKSYRSRYEKYLRLPQFDLISDRPLTELTAGDLEAVRDRILVAYRASTAHRAVRQGREMLTWAWSYHAAKAGLGQVQYPWWERWAVKYKSKVRHHTPKIEEIARTIVIADMFRKLSDNEHETYPGTVGALWAAALTAQRTGSLLVLRPDRLFAPEKKARLPGWKIANWSAEEMKGGKDGGRPHALPLPPDALKVLERFRRDSDQKSPWMFSGRKGSERITQSALNLLMYRLQGRVYDHRGKNKPDRPGKPGPKAAKEAKVRVDLFAYYGIRPWTLHDIRRTLGQFMDDKRLGGAASAILGHKLPRDEMPERERMAPVTEIHYNSSQRIGLKAEGMALWTRTLLAACEKERRALSRKKLPSLLPPQARQVG